ncbi:MAG TPA: GNAT family N-acetyltransferase [Streptosporangiaceae bacterium]|nr:GNAT family N-acetyltransferase [Streptosporangiaceae bacterium]
MLIRDALPSEMTKVGDIRVAAYLAGNHLDPSSGYETRLRTLGADGIGDVLLAVEAGAILGTIMLQPWPAAGEVVTGPGEAEIRALAVAPSAQRGGVGSALLMAIIERARFREVRHLVLLTQPDMTAARSIYKRAGFVRLPERDFSPRPESPLLAYGMRLPAAG